MLCALLPAFACQSPGTDRYERLLDIVHRPARDARGFEHADPVIGRRGGKDRVKLGFQLRLMPGPDPIRSELVYVPIRDQDIPSTTLACCISEEGTPSAAVSVCLQALRNALERWFRDGSC